MKVVVKNIQQKVFEIEMEASSTVRDVKNRLNEQHAIGAPELLKLIFQGKVLADDEKTLNGTDSVNYSEDEFMVVMVSRAKAPAAASSAASPSASSAVPASASAPAQSRSELSRPFSETAAHLNVNAFLMKRMPLRMLLKGIVMKKCHGC
jgi:UV excision repair protein RAD23